MTVSHIYFMYLPYPPPLPSLVIPFPSPLMVGSLLLIFLLLTLLTGHKKFKNLYLLVSFHIAVTKCLKIKIS